MKWINIEENILLILKKDKKPEILLFYNIK